MYKLMSVALSAIAKDVNNIFINLNKLGYSHTYSEELQSLKRSKEKLFIYRYRKISKIISMFV